MSKDDILQALKILIRIRDGKEEVMISIIWVIVVFVVLAKRQKKSISCWFSSWNEAVKERLSVAEAESLMPQDLINAKAYFCRY